MIMQKKVFSTLLLTKIIIKMRVIILFFISLAYLFVSCGSDKCLETQKEVQTVMRDFYKKRIRFPKEMETLNEAAKKFKIEQVRESNSFTIVHFFKADCDKCIKELSQIQTFLASKKEIQKVNYIFIASAPTKIYVLDAIKKIKFDYPVYYEKVYYSFKNINELPLEDELFNTMLLNENKEALLFGSFYNNTKAERLFYDTINCGV